MPEKTEEKKKKYFKASEHLVDKGGKKFITYVGLQMVLLDQGKFVKETSTEVLQWPWENPYHLFICRVTMVVANDKGVEAKYQAIGDAGIVDNTKSEYSDFQEFGQAINNVGKMVAPHFFRMGETRAAVRCLRQATRSEYTASEEIA